MADNKIASANTSGLVKSTAISVNANRPAYEGKLDSSGDVRLRLGIVDNPLIKRSSDKAIDPIDPYNVINLQTGHITVRWLEQDGGIVRSSSFGKFGKEGEDSDKESLKLTHPMIWANDSNWCGINYLPPVGSVVVVGFRKHNQPVVLGYIQPHYEVVTDIELGEIMNKGYGNTTSHWKMHDEQEHKSWVEEGTSRPVKHLSDQPGRKFEWKDAPYTVGLKLRLKAWIDPFNPDDKKEMIEMYAYKSKDGNIQEHSLVEVRPESITNWSESSADKSRSEMTIAPAAVTIKSGRNDSPAASYITMTPGNIREHASETITKTAGKISINGTDF